LISMSCGNTRKRLVGWDDRWAYLEHRIETSDGKPVAIAMARAGFRSGGAWMSIEALRVALPHRLPDMVLPAHVRAWQALDGEFGSLIGRGRRDRPPMPDTAPDDMAEVAEFAQ
jgi:hypothetical protein